MTVGTRVKTRYTLHVLRYGHHREHGVLDFRHYEVETFKLSKGDLGKALAMLIEWAAAPGTHRVEYVAHDSVNRCDRCVSS